MFLDVTEHDCIIGAGECYAHGCSGSEADEAFLPGTQS